MFSGCSTSAYENKNESALPAEFPGIYKQAVTSPLERAISETNDPELAQFSQKLLQGYELDKLNTDISSDTGDMASLLPDIKNINKVAMETTLKEAGKTLSDPELSEFYSSFMKRIGVDN